MSRVRPGAIRRALRVPRAQVITHYAPITDAEACDLFVAAGAARTPERARALLAVLLDGGLRAAEVAGLDVGDLHPAGDGLLIHVRQGKGGKDRRVPVTAASALVIRRYLAAGGRTLGTGASVPLFLRAGTGRDRLTAQGGTGDPPPPRPRGRDRRQAGHTARATPLVRAAPDAGGRHPP